MKAVAKVLVKRLVYLTEVFPATAPNVSLHFTNSKVAYKVKGILGFVEAGYFPADLRE